jgi:pyridinium-3,5-bisthiocarboxylic acid mononucleotide nickel chelatase
MNVLYCDCFSGISGDMFLSALVDAGLPVDYLNQQLAKLNISEFRGITARQVHKGPLAATQVSVNIVYDPQEDHHRHLDDIIALIETSDLSAAVKQTCQKIFQTLAEAEAQVHGTNIQAVHFHEVGAVDSIIDIVGAAIGLEYFQIEAVYSSPLPLTSGQINTEHGVLPLPAPATLGLMKKAQALLTPCSACVELVTPTGAAILASMATFCIPSLKLNKVGVGAGQLDLEWPNIMRVIIGGQE